MQFSDKQWIRGKAADTFCPLGPVVVGADEVADPQALPIACRVNGATLQDSNTREMIFPVSRIVSFISRAITLEPGDVILTGTPDGVGVFRDPKVFLKPGDRVEVEIADFGVARQPRRRLPLSSWTSRRLRWGILGAARINRSLIPAFRAAAGQTIEAIASRDAREGARGGRRRGDSAGHGSYEALLADPASTPSTFRCRIISTPSGPSRRLRPASTCCARSRSR